MIARYTHVLAMACEKHRLAEKCLVAPFLRVGHQWLDAVVHSGQPAVNVRINTMKGLALDLAVPEMAANAATLIESEGAARIAEVQVAGENSVVAVQRDNRIFHVYVVDPVGELADEPGRVHALPDQMTGIEIGDRSGDAASIGKMGYGRFGHCKLAVSPLQP